MIRHLHIRQTLQNLINAPSIICTGCSPRCRKQAGLQKMMKANWILQEKHFFKHVSDHGYFCQQSIINYIFQWSKQLVTVSCITRLVSLPIRVITSLSYIDFMMC